MLNLTQQGSKPILCAVKNIPVDSPHFERGDTQSRWSFSPLMLCDARSPMGRFVFGDESEQMKYLKTLRLDPLFFSQVWE